LAWCGLVKERKTVLILSVDGGGVRGIAAAILLRRLEEEVPGWIAKVDLFTGASTGGIIALALAYGLHPDEIERFYRAELPEIFSQSWWRRWMVLWRAKYSNKALRESLRSVFKDARLGDLARETLISTYFLGSREPFERAHPKFYSRRRNPKTKLADLALWTSSAPTFFPSADRHVDGGLSANNCAVCAMAFADRYGASLSDMTVLSVSTGLSPMVLEGGDRGLAYWGRSIPETLIDGGVDVADYQARHFLADEGTYHRLHPELGEEIPLDDVARLDDLCEFAESVDLTSATSWLAAQVG